MLYLVLQEILFMKLFLPAILLSTISLFGQLGLVYPKATQSNQTDTIWGKVVSDPYRWMENITSPEVATWLDEEKKLSEGYTKKNFELMKDYLVKYSYTNYKTINKQGKYYFSYAVSDASETASLYYKEHTYGNAILLFNPNFLDKKTPINIAGINLSADEKTLALALSKKGGDWETIRFLDMETKKLLDDTISFVKYSGLHWYKDGVFYVKYGVRDTKESFTGTTAGRTLFYHKLGTKQWEDVLVYRPSNTHGDFNFEVTPEEKYLILYKDTLINKTTTIQVSAVELHSRSKFDFKIFISVISKKYPGFNVLGELNGKLLVKSTFNAPSGAIYGYNPNEVNKKEILVPAYKEKLEHTEIVGNKLLTVYSSDSSSSAYIRDSTGKIISYLTTPTGYKFNRFSYSSSDNMLLCSFYSFYAPPTIYQYNLTTYKAEQLGETYLNHNIKDYITRKVYYYSKDSTLVPMYITHKKKLKLDGNNPTLLYGYGGFGISMNPSYDAAHIIFMQSGGVLATPCLRGGGDFPGWHEQGMKLKKQNTFDDFIAAAEYLIANKYTNPTKIAAMGGSNGGLLVGATMLQRPDLFRVVVSQAGLLDMIRFNLYNIGYLWEKEYGKVKDSISFVNLLKYSPVHNVKQGVNYPSTLLVASDNDDRVNPFHSFKFLAELQAKGSSTHPYLLYYEKDGGHSGSMVSENYTNTRTYIYCFIFKELGMEKKIEWGD
jgi:prolyl oligopeptidase